MNEYEVRYITHPLTHVDFLVYNTITKEPILVIEVDGTRYHELNTKQALHDEIKNRILVSNKIKILRLKTNESNEEYRIKEVLNHQLEYKNIN